MLPEPTVFVVDDDEAVRKSFEWLIGSIGLKTESFASAVSYFEGYDPERPGCLVLDVRMPGMSGLELQEKLRRDGVTIPVIVVSGHGDVPTAVRSLKNGALDFIEKPFNDQLMLERIQLGIERDAKIRLTRVAQSRFQSCLKSLTPREREVMSLVVEGKSNKEIARDLDISPKTVEVHRARVMAKMQAKSLAQLVRVSESCIADTGFPR